MARMITTPIEFEADPTESLASRKDGGILQNMVLAIAAFKRVFAIPVKMKR
jgi:hypothetical protein